MFLKIGSGIETDCEENQAYPISQQRKKEKRMTLLSFMIDGVPRAIELEFIINRLLVKGTTQYHRSTSSKHHSQEAGKDFNSSGKFPYNFFTWL